MSSSTDSGRSYHLKCTGEALTTADAHSSPSSLTLFGSCFCPFVQRMWVALEYLDIDYQYYEVDPYKKPPELLEVSPKGLVPALKFNGEAPPKSINESSVILELLEEYVSPPLLTVAFSHQLDRHSLAAAQGKGSLLPSPSDPYARALVRLQADHVNRTLVPAFYRYLQAQDQDKQIEGCKEFASAIEGLVALFKRAEAESKTDVGLWRDGGKLGLADVMAAPWLFRSTNALTHYRGFPGIQVEGYNTYLDKLVSHPAFKKTCSTEELYLESYERYAYNRPNTSQVANAINSGRALP